MIDYLLLFYLPSYSTLPLPIIFFHHHLIYSGDHATLEYIFYIAIYIMGKYEKYSYVASRLVLYFYPFFGEEIKIKSESQSSKRIPTS